MRSIGLRLGCSFAPAVGGILLFLLLAPAARGAEALVAVAANFSETIDAMKPAFARATGHKIVATIGSTGKLYAQIRNGAPFHILLSADTETPERLEKEGFAIPGTRFTYAVGRLTLWSGDPKRIEGDGTVALKAGNFRHLALANPDLAPYGAAAREALRALGLWETLSGKIVMGQNIGQTYAMVATGNAELGFVALSAVVSPRAPSSGSRWDVPQRLYAPIRQDAVLLDPGKDNAAATAFLRFLRSEDARKIAVRFGYGIE